LDRAVQFLQPVRETPGDLAAPGEKVPESHA